MVLKKIKIFPFVLILIMAITKVQAQNADLAFYDWFDNQIGQTNLGINNGKVHINNKPSFDKTHRYYSVGNFMPGEVEYDGQYYHNVWLRYDLLNDVATARVAGKDNVLSIDLIREKTKYFLMDGKRFVNLNYDDNGTPKFVNGFYQEDSVNNELLLYTKYSKTSTEVMTFDGTFYKFDANMHYVLEYRKQFFQLDSESDIRNIFPQQTQSIRDFYNRNSALKKENMRLFLKNLLQLLGDTPLKDTSK